MKIIQENEYLDAVKNEVEPYLKAHCREKREIVNIGKACMLVTVTMIL